MRAAAAFDIDGDRAVIVDAQHPLRVQLCMTAALLTAITRLFL